MNYVSHAWSFDRKACKVFVAHIGGTFPASGDTLRFDDGSGVGLTILSSQWLDESRDSGVRVLVVGGDQADAVNALYEGVQLVGENRPMVFASEGEVHAALDFDAPLPPNVQSSFEAWDVACEEDESVSTGAMEEQRRKARRLALHHAAVRALREHPDRARRALEILDRWIENGFPDQNLATEWRRIIVNKDWEVFLEDSKRGERLRKGSPLGCIVDQEVRLAIFQRFAKRT